MTRSPVTIHASAPLSKAVALLASLDVRHLPVVDGKGVLVGMLSDRDVYGEVVPDATVESVMSARVLSVGPEADLEAIAKLMIDYKIGAVPVVDADQKPVGIVSYVDILRSLTR